MIAPDASLGYMMERLQCHLSKRQETLRGGFVRRYLHRVRRNLLREVFFLLCAFSALAVLFLADRARAESLRESLALAYRTNPVLNAQIANRDGARAGVMRSDARWFPSITASGNYGTSDAESKAGGVTVKDDRDPWGYDFTLNQNIFAGGGHLAGSRQARANARAAGHGLRQTIQQVLFDAATAYFNVLRDEAIVSLNERNVSVLRRHLRAVQQRFQVGEITRTDVAQSEARLARARSRLASARASLTVSRNFYIRVIGIPPQDLSFPALPVLARNLDDAVADAGQQHPSLASARANTEAARAALVVARAAFFPSLDLEARYRYAGEPASGVSSQRATTVTGRLTIPLFRGFGNYAGVRQASYALTEAQFRESQTIRQINEAVVNAWDALTAARAQIISDSEQERANRIAYEGVSQEADLGSRTTLEVLDAQQELLDAQVALATSRRQEQVAAYGLLSAMGALNARNLDLEDDLNLWVSEEPSPFSPPPPAPSAPTDLRP